VNATRRNVTHQTFASGILRKKAGNSLLKYELFTRFYYAVHAAGAPASDVPIALQKIRAHKLDHPIGIDHLSSSNLQFTLDTRRCDDLSVE
jgi:hypothetical protein